MKPSALVTTLGAVVLVTSVALAGTLLDLVPTERVGEEATVSLREESARSGGAFFLGYAVGRGHRGGGLRGGK